MTKSKTGPSNTLRVIAGKWRSRKLEFPDIDGLRPTADRVRETLFNWLQEPIAYARCLDLFAGSGACGIEALSRGARFVTFVDVSPSATSAIRRNLALLQAEDYEVVCEDSLTWLGRKNKETVVQYDVVFLDPPFASDLLKRAVAAVERSDALASNAYIYIESAQELAVALLPENWHLSKAKKAGKVYFYLYQRRDRTDGNE